MPTLILQPSQKRALTSLNSDQAFIVPDFSHGETVPLTIGIAEKITAQLGARLYQPVDVSGWTIRAALGKGFQLPVAGEFTITYGGDETVGISYNPTAEEISDALNDLSSIIAAGGVTVEGEDGFFTFTFTDVGVRTALDGDAENLAPLSVLDFGRLIEGTAELKDVQILRIVQNPGAFVDLTEDNDPADAVVTVVTVGGGGNNHKIRVTLTPAPYDGRWTITIDGEESTFIGYNDSQATVRGLLEAMASVGTGNVEVAKEADGQYLIGFKGDHADEDMGTITTDASGLQVTSTKSGVLDLRTSGIDLLLNGVASTSVYFEIEGTPPGGTVQKLYRKQCTLVDSIIDPSNQSPMTLADAPFVSTENLIVSPTITDYTGGGATKVDGIVTTSKDVGVLLQFVHSTGGLKSYQLQAGTDAEASPGIIRPDDYSAGTNEKIWVSI